MQGVLKNKYRQLTGMAFGLMAKPKKSTAGVVKYLKTQFYRTLKKVLSILEYLFSTHVHE